jgi:hypothetical protein
MNSNVGSRDKVCYTFPLRWIVKKCDNYKEIWRSTERYSQYPGIKSLKGHFEVATVLCFPHGVTPISLKAKAGWKGGEFMRSGLKKRLMSFLRTVYDEKSDIFLSQQTGRGFWIVLVGPVKYDKEKKKQKERERKKRTQMMILVEQRFLVLLNIVLEKKDVLSTCSFYWNRYRRRKSGIFCKC